MKVRVILPRLILALALAAGIVWALLNRGLLHAGTLQMQIHNLGPWAPLAFIVLFALATVLFPPGWIFGLVRRFWRSGPRWVDVAELRAQLARGEDLIVVDVRGPDEFSGPLGHIPVARNIPLSDLPTRLKELESEKHRRVTLVCRTDKRSAKAADLLQKSGFADVAVLRGGMEQWNRQALSVAAT